MDEKSERKVNWIIDYFVVALPSCVRVFERSLHYEEDSNVR